MRTVQKLEQDFAAAITSTTHTPALRTKVPASNTSTANPLSTSHDPLSAAYLLLAIAALFPPPVGNAAVN